MKRFALLFVLLGAACGGEEQGPVAGEEFMDMEADQVLFDVRHFMTKDGVRQAVLLADTAFLNDANGELDLRRVNLTLYGENGEERATLTALAGHLNTRTQAMTARGNAVLVTREGNRRIETEELHYDPATDRVWSDVATTMHEDGSVVRGTGFTADGRMTNVRVTNPTGTLEGVQIEF